MAPVLGEALAEFGAQFVARSADLGAEQMLDVVETGRPRRTCSIISR
jgi:hypothetical protein